MVWPGGEVPLPPVPVWDVAVHEGGWLVLVGEPREVEVPPDFYLHEMHATAPSTDEEIVEFVRRWGRSSDPYSRDLPEQLRPEVQTALQQDGLLPEGTSLDAERTRIIESLPIPAWDTYLARTRRLVHVREVRERLDSMDRLAELAADGLAGAERDEHDWDWLAEWLNPALSAFQVRIDVGGFGGSVALPDVSAYSVAALQLLNDVAQKTPMLRCGNERCPHGGLFTRQRGRARFGQHRTLGTKYCSSSCARAQGERDRRRRQRREGAQ